MAWNRADKSRQQARLQGGGDGGLPSMDTELSARIMNMEIDGSFGQAQDHPHFPTGLAERRPLQA